jgi:YD repeat-containing protein
MRLHFRLFILGAFFCATEAAYAGPQWTQNPALLGNTTLGGGLALAVPLVIPGAAPEFGLSLNVVHGLTEVTAKPSELWARRNYLRGLAKLPALPPLKLLAKDEMEKPEKVSRSAWSIPQLSSIVYPANRDMIIWRPLGGGEGSIFRREDMGVVEGQTPRFSPEGWHCTELAPGAYRILNREGWAWEYREGLPSTLTAPSGRLLEFIHDKGLMVKIVQRLNATDKGTQVDVLKVVYDAQRRPIQLNSGLIEHRFVYDKVTGHLFAWHSNALNLAAGGPARIEVTANNPETAPAINLEAAGDPGLAESGARLATLRFAYFDDVLMAIQWPGGRIDRFKWDATRTKLTEDADSRYAWSASGGLISLSRTDLEGRTARVEYNILKEEMTTVGADGTRATTAYQRRSAGKGLLREQRGADGRLLSKIDYNDRHLPVRMRKLGEPEIRNVYDNRDRLVEVWRAPAAPLDDASSALSTGKAAAVTVPETKGEIVQRFTYDGGSRNPATITDALGQTTRYSYDEFGQVSQIVNPGGAILKQRYDTWGRLVYRELPEGALELIKYDAYGRVVERKAADGSVSTVDYDKQGRIRQRTEAGEVYSHRYDDGGRPIEVQRNQKPWLKWTYSNGVIITPLQPKKAPANWPRGPVSITANTVKFTDPQGHETTRFYDQDGNLVQVINPLGEWSTYRYNRVGETVGWIDARGHGLVFQRDNAGRIVKQENALGQVLNWRFDGAGRLAERSSKEQRATYAFDPAGRLTSVDYGKGQVVTYERDGYGRLLSAATGEVSTSYRYDALDRPVRVEQRPREGAPSGLEYTYTPMGQKGSVTVLKPDSAGRLVPASTTSTVYDGAGRVKSIELDGTRTATHTYDPKTQLLATKFLGNGLSYRYAYDERGRMSLLEVASREGVIKQRLRYNWDDYGQLASKVLEREAQPGKPAPAKVELNYKYDELGRLASVISPQDPKQTRLYRYDAAGNLVENRSSDKWLKMEYDAANQLVTKKEAASEGEAETLTTFAYDTAGRMVRESHGSQVEREFTYGYLDKVLSVDRPGGRKANYAYDAGGMLVRKEVDDPTQAATSSGTGVAGSNKWETWVWDGLALVQRGNEVYVNEAHPAGGMTLMSRTMDTPVVGAAPPVANP